MGLPTLHKVKLKLVQPAIKCSGRDDVTCYYKGKVKLESDGLMWVEIKSHGENIMLTYDKQKKKFSDLKNIDGGEWNDLVIV